ncbi:PEGA domain-containing protein [candidate division WOR-3 bacterium]|nr:PEGA domain-containing protein [candidate division WOR-3 bacterium]
MNKILNKVLSKGVIMILAAVSFLSAQEEEPSGNLGITSTPEDVAIWLDGNLVGYTTPFMAEQIPLGLHRLILTHQGYKTWRDTVRVRADKVTTVEAVLDTLIFKENMFLPHNLANFYDFDHESIKLDLSAYRTSRVASWELSILDMYGNVFRTLEGKRKPPKVVAWDGRGEDSLQLATVGDIYTFIFRLHMKDGSTTSRVGEDIIDLNGAVSGNVVAVKEKELTYYGTVPPPGVTKYYDYVIERFETTGYARITVKASAVEITRSIVQYLAIEAPYARLNTAIDSTFSRVEFILD